jgi:hypothetical protein
MLKVVADKSSGDSCATEFRQEEHEGHEEDRGIFDGINGTPAEGSNGIFNRKT